MKPTDRASSCTCSEDKIVGAVKSNEELQLQLVGASLKLETIAQVLREASIDVGGAAEVSRDSVDLAVKISAARLQSAQLLAEHNLTPGPVLDILLDLFVCESMGRSVSVSDAVIASRCSASTGVRWVHVLEEGKLVKKSEDITDRRRTFLSLTPHGLEIVLGCIKAYATA